MDAIFWGGIQRFIEAATESAPTILVGLVIAAIFHRLLGAEGTRNLFGNGTRWALPKAWALGMLLPVCSLGVIPILRRLRKDGMSGGTILAFGLTAPLFNPLSVLYGLSLSEPFVILSFAMASLLVVTTLGLSFDHLFPGRAIEEEPDPPVSHGPRRMVALFVSMAREVASPTSVYVLIGLLGVVLLNVCLPAGSLMDRMERDNPTAALEMAPVAVPIFTTPIAVMGKLGSMFQHGNSVAAAFVLLTLGAGMNLGLLAWVFRTYGMRTAGLWSSFLLVMVVGLAYGMDGPLTAKGVAPAGHTHAFDSYCCPYPPGSASLDQVQRKLADEVMPHEVKALGVMFAFGVGGFLLTRLDRSWKVEDWLERPTDPDAERPRSKYDVNVPAPVLGGVALLGLLAFSILASYAYYPPSDQIFEDLGIIKAEVLTAALSGDEAHADYFIPIYQDWVRRLQVSVYLREGTLSPYRRMKTRVLIDKIERLDHAIGRGDEDQVRRSFVQVTAAHQRLRNAFRGD